MCAGNYACATVRFDERSKCTRSRARARTCGRARVGSARRVRWPALGAAQPRVCRQVGRPVGSRELLVPQMDRQGARARHAAGAPRGPRSRRRPPQPTTRRYEVVKGDIKTAAHVAPPIDLLWIQRQGRASTATRDLRGSLVLSFEFDMDADLGEFYAHLAPTDYT